MKLQEGSKMYVLSGSGGPSQAEGVGPPIAVSWSVSEFDLAELLRKLWRRRWLIAGTVLTIMAISLSIIEQLTPRYTAVAYVEISPRQSRVFDFESVLSGLPADTATIETEMKIIQSRKLAERVIERLDLIRSPEFNPSLQTPTKVAMKLKEGITFIKDSLGNARELLESVFPSLFLPGEPLEVEGVASVEEEYEAGKARVINTFLSRLTVAPEGRSRVVAISFVSEGPRTAAKVANTVADFYLVSQLDAKFEATKRANVWLNDRIVELRREVEVAERTVEEFREQSGLIRGARDVSLASEQISDLSTQHVLERTRLAEAEARLRQVERLLVTPGMIETASEVLASPLIRDLRREEARVERVVAEFSEEYGERHPKMINARAELRDLRAKISSVVDKVIQGLRNEVAVARARAGSLDTALEKLTKEVAQLNKHEVQLRALEREGLASRSLLETLLARSKETTSQEDFQQADANILSYAPAPRSPSYPKKIAMLGVSFLGSIFVGVFLAFATEQLDHGFRSMEQVERLLGVKPLGLVPTIGGLGMLGKKPEAYILDKPMSAFGEAIRSFHTNLLLSNDDRRPKVILVSSSLPKEGKTTVAISLARMLASIGQRVLLIDCDLRRPVMHKSLGLSSIPGLVDCLDEKVSLDNVIQEDKYSGVHFLGGGTSTTHPPSILSSDSMKRLLEMLKQAYDIVILDSAPVMAVSDSLVLSRLVDKTVFLIRWRETRRETATIALKQLMEAGADIAGVLLTMVNVKEHAQYGFGDSGSYVGKIRKYYSS